MKYLPQLVLCIASALVVAAPTAVGNGGGHDICEDEEPIVIADSVYLIFDSLLADGYVAHFSLYAESNGEAGLQRGGVSLIGESDECQSSATPDTLILSSYEVH